MDFAARRSAAKAIIGVILFSFLASTGAEVAGETAPAVVASSQSEDSKTPGANSVDEYITNSSTAPSSGDSRDARFLSWPSFSRAGSEFQNRVHPTIATFTHRASQLSDILRRAAKFLSTFAATQEDDESNNEIDVDSVERKENPEEELSPSAALNGLYTECVMRLSVPCVQRKLLLFLDRLGRMQRFRLLGDFLTVVRVEPRHAESRRYILDENEDVADLSTMADNLVDDFFDSHVVRFSLPGTLRVARSSQSPVTTVDLRFERASSSVTENAVEGRGQISLPQPNKKKQKMIRKIKKKLMKVLMMVMSILMVMGPMGAGMAGGTSMMALMLGSLSLLITKIIVIKKAGGSVTSLLGSIGSSIGNLAGVGGGGGGGGGSGGSSSYHPTGTGGGSYARSDSSDFYDQWAQRSFGYPETGGFDPMAMAYGVYKIASQLK